ncbi:N-acetylmuramoyl-L-alanine amidase family protein [Desulfosporosinus nitroreducens]|uniref:N-acetylmuramoyl-L-alanine amidase family protein n=1 Tax=Desulfosporosinus nitroreducens TaxID=2018668 RepID=UPI00207D031B|nr:N-acetylmuramoyl-L-alanine amidase [Desulfosporosinus nitroreducens]MCO1603651.1 N-acetylmuramoyl-L-alanine amidase [Desulfosporosinus nitroreducens]
MKAVINYGHGPKDVGHDPGAIGPTGYQETTQNKEVGERVVNKLKVNGWEILAIQDGDLWDVTNGANDFNPDYFLSIHANSFADNIAHGVETIALAAGGMGEKMAKEIQKELVAATGLTNRGVKFNNLHVLRETDCPATLVEIGFISNPAEEALMKQDLFDETVASAICRGFSRAVGVPYTEAVNPVAPNPEPTVMYRIIIDNKQSMALSSQDDAIAEVKKSIDAGQAQKGCVQRNTDFANIFEYAKVQITTPTQENPPLQTLDPSATPEKAGMGKETMTVEKFSSQTSLLRKILQLLLDYFKGGA